MREDQQSVITLEQPAGESKNRTSDLPSWMIFVVTVQPQLSPKYSVIHVFFNCLNIIVSVLKIPSKQLTWCPGSSSFYLCAIFTRNSELVHIYVP